MILQTGAIVLAKTPSKSTAVEKVKRFLRRWADQVGFRNPADFNRSIVE
jgi:hypothetical protein